ncbi:MAG: inorganic phosphate transporter [Thermoprotei archaeon]|nr:MAG: inorganic phosphate transporter [Thermoprotei archaeon]
MAYEIIYMVLGIAAAMFIAWNLGANDAANPTNAAVGCGAISLKKALLMFSLFAAVGALVQGYMVMKTIGKGVVKDIDPLGALVASVSAGVWIMFCTWKGMPVSTTHSTIGSVLGIGFAHLILSGKTRIDWTVVFAVILSWITSPLLAIILSISLYFLFGKVALYLLSKRRNVDMFFKGLLVFNLAFSAYAFGVNDVGNATGVYIAVVSKIFGIPDMQTMFILAILGSVGIAFGALTWGYRVINTVGFRITRLDYISAAAAILSNALIVWCFSTIPKFVIGYGMPISTTHASVSSVIGVGIAKVKGLAGVDWKVVGYIVASWILTVPIAAFISISIYTLLTYLIP